MFSTTLDGVIRRYEENTDAKVFEKVMIYAGNPWIDAPESAKIKNLSVASRKD